MRFTALGEQMRTIVTAAGFATVWEGLDAVPAPLRSEFFGLYTFMRDECLRHLIAGPWYSAEERDERLANSRTRSPLRVVEHAPPPQSAPAAPQSRRRRDRPYPSREAEETILEVLWRATGPLSRKELARLTGYTPGTTAHYAAALVAAGILQKCQGRARRGYL
jgi:hypothetical protein